MNAQQILNVSLFILKNIISSLLISAFKLKLSGTFALYFARLTV